MQVTLNTQQLSQLNLVLDYVLQSEQQHYDETLETNPSMADAHIYAVAKALMGSIK